MLKLKYVRYKNFVSTGNVFTEFKLDEHKNILIIGENGSGKSTLIDALTYGLFGRPFRKVNKPQLLNSITKRDMIVEVEFNSNNIEYMIRRGFNPKAQEVNILEIYQNGELLSKDADIRDYQEYIEKYILKTNYKTFCSVVILGSASYIPFMQLDAQKRRDIVEDLLDLKIFTIMKLLLKEKIDTCDSNISKIERDKGTILGNIKLVKEHIRKLEKVNEFIILEKKETIKGYNRDIQDNQVEIGKINDIIRLMQSEMGNINTVKQKLNSFQSMKHKIDSKLSSISKEHDFFNKNETCPTCEQPIDIKFKENKISSLSEKYTQISDGLIKLEEEIEKTNNMLTEINLKIFECNRLNREISQLKIQIETWLSSISDIEKEIKSTEDTTSNTKESIDKLKEYEIFIKDYEDKLKKELDNKELLSLASVMLKDNGIKARLIKQYVPIINKLLGKYLGALDFFCQFELDETFTETIKSRARDIFTYGSFSEGEKTRIDLAVMFTWRALAKMRNSMSCNLLIFDEILDGSLDNLGLDEFIKIIQSLTDSENIIIISHKELFQDKFDKVIKFEKVKNFSQIVEKV